MKYAVDRIENDIVILEEIETKKIIEIPISSFNFPVNESDIIIIKDKTYEKDDKIKNERVNTILDKFKRAKQIKF